MKAKKAKIETVEPSALGVDVTPQLATVQVLYAHPGGGGGHACKRLGCGMRDAPSARCHGPLSLQVDEPPKRKTGAKVANVQELVQQLRQKGLV